MNILDKDDAYFRARKHVECLRGFYVHAAIYVLINSGITIFKLLRNFRNGETFNEAFFDLGTFFIWGLWGIGLALHAFSVYGIPFILGKNWEDKKLKEFMNEEENQDQWT